MATNFPPLLFGATYFHSLYSKSDFWPESLRKNGIHRRKFVVAGVVLSLFGPILHRISISSKVLRQSLEAHGYNFPPTNDERKLISTVMKQIQEDSKNGVSLTESTKPVQGSLVKNILEETSNPVQ